MTIYIVFGIIVGLIMGYWFTKTHHEKQQSFLRLTREEAERKATLEINAATEKAKLILSEAQDEIARLKAQSHEQNRLLTAQTEQNAQQLLSEARQEAREAQEESKRLILAAQETAQKTEKELEQQREHLDKLRRSLEQEAENQERLHNNLAKRANDLQAKEEKTHAELESLRQTTKAEAQKLYDRVNAELEARKQDLAEERKENRSEREELKRESEKLSRRADQLDERQDQLTKMQEELHIRDTILADGIRDIEEQEAEVAALKQHVELKLHEVASLSREAAQKIILDKLEVELEEQKAIMIKRTLAKVTKEAKARSVDILAAAMYRNAAETTKALTTTVIPLHQNTDRSRIIGRKGRNNQSLENVLSVDLVHDQSDVVIISSFNPFRREIARKVLVELINDGRIHPSRVEEAHRRAQSEMFSYYQEQGEIGALDAGVSNLPEGLIHLLGALSLRRSYSQNILHHSIQVAHISGIIASELGLNPALARQAGLLHDIGKSADREIGGSHVTIGVSIGERFSLPPEVIDAIAHHHDPENGTTPYSAIVAAADAISASRPGVRNTNQEQYFERLEHIEKIASSFPGVKNAYCISGGREVRIFVHPEKVSDTQATLLSYEISNRIEKELEYPGEISVVVIRESRSTSIAH